MATPPPPPGMEYRQVPVPPGQEHQYGGHQAALMAVPIGQPTPTLPGAAPVAPQPQAASYGYGQSEAVGPRSASMTAPSAMVAQPQPQPQMHQVGAVQMHPQYMAAQRGMVPSGKWSSGLFDCFNDIESCLITYLVGCYPHGKIVAKVEGNDDWLVPTLLWVFTAGCCLPQCLFGPQRRSKFRQKYNLPEDDTCGDFPAACCCPACAICQEWRELKFRNDAF